MTARPLLLVALVSVLLSGLAAARADAVTLYGGGSVPPTAQEAVPLFLVSVERGHVRVAGFSGGSCSNGNQGYGRFVSRPARLRRGGRFRTRGSFAYSIPGGVARGSYQIRGTVRAKSGLATGVASVRVRYPSTTGAPVICRGLKRRFRARNPAAGGTGRVRGPFYGLTSQGLPILIRPSPDSSAVAPVAIWSTLSCAALGPVQPIQQLRVARTNPGVYAETGHTTGGFVPALGSAAAIPLGTYTYTDYNLQLHIARGLATGMATLSSKVGDAGKQLIDTCSAPPITFIAVP